MMERRLFLYASSGEAVEQLEHECKTLVSVAYKTIDSLGPPLQLRLPKLKHISAETLP